MQKDGSDRAVEVEFLRSNPVRVTIDKEPFLWEMYLGEARVIPTDGGGVEMEVTFNSHGRTLLENYTAANKGRRMVIAAEFDKQRRILAAPRITKLLSNGVIRFTPDASPEEAERIVNGWNNIAEVKRKKDKF